MTVTATCRSCRRPFEISGSFAGRAEPTLCRGCARDQRARLVTLTGTIISEGERFSVVQADGGRYMVRPDYPGEWPVGVVIAFEADPQDPTPPGRLPLARSPQLVRPAARPK